MYKLSNFKIQIYKSQLSKNIVKVQGMPQKNDMLTVLHVHSLIAAYLKHQVIDRVNPSKNNP